MHQVVTTDTRDRNLLLMLENEFPGSTNYETFVQGVLDRVKEANPDTLVEQQNEIFLEAFKEAVADLLRFVIDHRVKKNS